MRVTLNEKDIEMMYDSKTRNFIKEQKKRFLVYPDFDEIKDDVITEYNKNDSLLFCEKFLEAKLIYEYYYLNAKSPLLLSDEVNGGWCVLIKQLFE